MKLPEEEIYRMNLLVKKCLIDITCFFLKDAKLLYSGPQPPPLSIFNFNVIERLVRIWYQKQTRIIGNHPLRQISQFPWFIKSLPYDLETIQFYIKEMAPFYFNSLVIQYIYEIEIQPAQRESFLSALPLFALERLYWLACAYNKKILVHEIATKYPTITTLNHLFICLEAALRIGDQEVMNGLWQEQKLRLIACNEEEKIKVLQKTTNMVCRYGRLIFFEQICTTLQKNNLLRHLSIEKMFANACRSGEISMIKAIMTLFQSQNNPSSFHLSLGQIRNDDPLFQVCLSGQIDAVNFLLTTIPSSLLPRILNNGAVYYLDAAISSQNLEVFHKICHLLPPATQRSIFSTANGFVYNHLERCPLLFLAPIFEKIPPENRESILSHKSYLNLITILLSNQRYNQVRFLLLKLPQEKRGLAIDKVKHNIEKNHYACLSTKNKQALFCFLDNFLATQTQPHLLSNEPPHYDDEAQTSSSNETDSLEASSIISSNFEDYFLESDTESEMNVELRNPIENPTFRG